MKLPPSNFPVWVCEKRGVRSINICKAEKLRIEYERRSQELIFPNGEMFGTQFNNTLIRAGQHVEQTPKLNRE
jgi:hypothetical protein